MSSRVPPGKRVLNVHVLDDEYAFVEAESEAMGQTLTMTVRLMIRKWREDRERAQEHRRERVRLAHDARALERMASSYFSRAVDESFSTSEVKELNRQERIAAQSVAVRQARREIEGEP